MPRSAPLRESSGPGAHWEGRALEAEREKVLARSRQIVRTSCELLAAEGFDGLTLRTVLERTGLSRRAFYERFPSMDELLLAVFEETQRRVGLLLRERIGAADDPLEQRRILVDHLVSLSTQADLSWRAVAMSREYLRLAESRPDELLSALEPVTSLIAELLAEGMKRGQVRAGDAREMAVLVHQLVAAAIHTALLARNHAQGRSLAGLRDNVWEFCRRAVAA